MMTKTKLSLLGLGVATVLLSGCQTLQSLAPSYDDIKEIDHNLYSVTVSVATESRVVYVREAAFDRATAYCGNMNKGAQLLDAVSKTLPEGGSQATLIFRCVHFLKAPDPGFFERDKTN